MDMHEKQPLNKYLSITASKKCANLAISIDEHSPHCVTCDPLLCALHHQLTGGAGGGARVRAPHLHQHVQYCYLAICREQYAIYTIQYHEYWK